jgi:hypothetical protein
MNELENNKMHKVCKCENGRANTLNANVLLRVNAENFESQLEMMAKRVSYLSEKYDINVNMDLDISIYFRREEKE